MPETEQTIALIKSHAVNDHTIADVINTITNSGGLTVDRCEKMLLTPEQVAAFYAEHAGRHYYDRLINTVSGPEGIIAIRISGKEAISRWRSLIGPTDPDQARKNAPESLRAKYGTIIPFNAFHGSDSPENAMREQNILWPE